MRPARVFTLFLQVEGFTAAHMAFTFILLMLMYTVRCDDTDPSTSIPTTKISVGNGDKSKPQQSAWDYIKGTKGWCDVYKKCCGKSQSPISLDVDPIKKQSFPPIKFHKYDEYPSTLTILNNGHTVVMTLKFDGSAPSISGGGLNGTYIFASVNFHWGSNRNTGSEHHLGDTGFPFEVQIVHVNKKYRSFADAVGRTDGLAILGILGEFDTENSTSLESVIENLPKIKYRGNSVTLKEDKIDLALGFLLPTKTSDFYRYFGSLTTPECQESVTWTIFRNWLLLSKEQLKEFRHLYASAKDEKPVALTTNVRPIQDLNNRTVYRASSLGSFRKQRSPFLMLIVSLMISCL